MFDAAARHASISEQPDPARQAELVLRDKRLFSLTLAEWREYLLLFSEEVLDNIDKLQQTVPGELVVIELLLASWLCPLLKPVTPVVH